jgi:hypothetical protein
MYWHGLQKNVICNKKNSFTVIDPTIIDVGEIYISSVREVMVGGAEVKYLKRVLRS